jgi:ribosomal protein S18 acetylase RimI-like enzyme
LNRKGSPKDLNEIMKIIKDAIIEMESKGIYQWDDIYPCKDIINKDIEEETLFVFIEDETIKAFIVLNEHQEEEYKNVDWKYKTGKQMVIHRLCVSPLFQGKGIARSLVRFAEDFGRGNGFNSIRLDAFTENKGACGLYEKLGYEKAGVVEFRKGRFYCFEKSL